MAKAKKTAPVKAAPAKVVKAKAPVSVKPAKVTTSSSGPKATFNIDEIKSLIEAVQASNINELKLEKDNFKVEIRHGAAVVTHAQAPAPIFQHVPSHPVATAPSSPAPAPKAEAPAAPAAEASVSSDNLITIKSPMIGTFYRAAGPGKPTFVNVGDEVKAGQVLCIIEAMKLFNEIESEVSGKIVKVLVDDATSVEYDQPLFLVQP